jgi:small subunit ribosomal protein S2
MADISLEDMLQAGVHFGHQTKYWNPKMDPYIFGIRNKIHIIDLQHTVELLKPALAFIKSVAQKNNKILFVATKRSATNILKEEAERCGMPYVNERWLGGMLTNYKTIRSSINRLENLLRQKEDGTFNKLTKKEGLKLQREIDKLQKAIGGVREMGGLPDALFVIDVKREAIAISEASKMGIPIVGIVDSNSSPEGIDYLVPGNDDAIRSISLFTRAVSDACIEGSKLATGLKPSSDASGPKIIKKEEKQKASDPNSDEKSPVEEGVVEESKESEKIKESKKIQESKQGDKKAEASEEDQKSEDSKEAKEN